MNNIIVDFERSRWYDVDTFAKELYNLSNIPQVRSAFANHLSLNHAILSFHLGRFRPSCEILKRLLRTDGFNSIELAQIALALAEIYLLQNQPAKVDELVMKIKSLLSGQDKNASGTFSDIDRRLRSVELRMNVMLHKAQDHLSNDEASFKLQDEDDFMKWFWLFIKAQSEFQNGNINAASKLIMLSDKIYDSMQAYDAQVVDYDNLRNFFGKYGYCRECLKLNALGCIFWRLNKPNLASVYFKRALDTYYAVALRNGENGWMEKAAGDGNVAKSKLPLYCRSSLIRLRLMQNYGSILLHLNQPSLAFDCLIEAVGAMNNNPLLWLRLAECCIMAHVMAENGDSGSERKKIVQEIIGVGPHRKIVIGTKSVTHAAKNYITGDQGAIPTLSLEFAYFCVKNASAVLPEVNLSDAQEAKDSKLSFNLPFCPSTSALEILKLKCSILCATCYICLCLGEPQTALQSAKALFNLKEIASDCQRILATLYAAEACFLLDKVQDSLNYLKADLAHYMFSDQSKSSTDSSSDVVYSSESQKSFKLALYFNLAVAYALHRDFQKAADALSIVSNDDLPIQAQLLRMYLLIQKGDVGDVRDFIVKAFYRSM